MQPPIARSARGSWFQDAVAAALGSMQAHQGCYVNPGAGQSDIIAGATGFEVKTTAKGAVNLSGNYLDIRNQYPLFKLLGLRTDVKPFPLWVLDMPVDPPERVIFERVMDASTPADEVVGRQLAERLSQLLVAAGTARSRAGRGRRRRMRCDGALGEGLRRLRPRHGSGSCGTRRAGHMTSSTRDARRVRRSHPRRQAPSSRISRPHGTACHGSCSQDSSPGA